MVKKGLKESSKEKIEIKENIDNEEIWLLLLFQKSLSVSVKIKNIA